MFIPKFNQYYYYIEFNGSISMKKNLDTKEDKLILKYGNCFRTQKDAKQELIKRRKIMTEECRLITKEELDVMKDNIEVLKIKLVQVKPELKEWVEKNFGRLK